MKKIIAIAMLACFLLAGCAGSEPAAPAPAQTEAPAAQAPAAEAPAPEAQPAADGAVISPLPDVTAADLSDCIVSVSLDGGFLYKDENGRYMMNFAVYTYDKFDMVDVAMLKEGDTLAATDGDVVIQTLERLDSGAVNINGGIENGGITLYTNDSGVFYVQGYSDAKSWYHVCDASMALSDAFVFTDSSDLDKEPVSYTAEQLMNDSSIVPHFVPQNTTVRLEGGQVAEMNRIYMP